jgi:Tol biopolymer transport system component
VILTSNYGDVAITPDGTRIVYAEGEEFSSSNRLAVRAMDQLEATTLSGAGGSPRNPFISPEGNWVGYFAFDGQRNALKKISIHGGPPVTLCWVAGFPQGASWGAADTIVFASAAGGLWRVASGAWLRAAARQSS